MTSIPEASSIVEDEEFLTEVEQLDRQIQSARDQIAALKHRHSTLTAYLLTNPTPNIQPLLDPAAKIRSQSKITEETLKKLRSRCEAQKTTSLRAIHRLCTSATTFQTRDPDPGAVDDGYVLGIRIEVFSSQSREFLIPYYLMLNRPWRESERKDNLQLHRHTFPPFVPVKEICKRWLPPPTASPDEVEKEQDLQSLTKELRGYIASYHRREDAVALLGQENTGYISRITLPDAENMEAKVYLKNGCTANIRVNPKGKIQKVLAKDDVGRRLYSLERQIKAMERIDTITLGEM